MINADKRITFFLLTLLLGLQILIYAPNAGTGFVTDDYEWIANSVVDGKMDFLRPFKITTGFFRPLVSLTYGIQYQIHGLNPQPFGWFNLFLHMMNILLVYFLLSSFEITKPYSLAASILFGLNLKCNSMAVGWISGRTSLLYGFFMLLSLVLYLKLWKRGSNHFWDYIPVGIAYFLALLSKETAAAAPVFVFFFYYTTSSSAFKKIKSAFMSSLVFIIPLVVYFILRYTSNAYSPFNTPDCYRFSFSPFGILRNLVEYFTRAGMLDLFLLLILGVFYLLFMRKSQGVIAGIDKKLLLPGAEWFLIFLLPVILLNVRSDLYSYIPQVGIHILFLALLFPLWNACTIDEKKRLFVILPVVILLVAWTGFLFKKASDYGEAGKNSSEFTSGILPVLSGLNAGSKIIIIDMDSNRIFCPSKTISYGFGAMLTLYFPGKKLTGEIISADKKDNLKNNDDSIVVFYYSNSWPTPFSRAFAR